MRLLKPRANSPSKIAAEHGVKPLIFEEVLRAAANIWPEDESIDDFNKWVREQRGRRD